jgi:hypothetical protein
LSLVATEDLVSQVNSLIWEETICDVTIAIRCCGHQGNISDSNAIVAGIDAAFDLS